jgi:thiamine biosynthesis protein ThiS
MKILVNGESREFGSESTVAHVLRVLDLDPRQVAVEVNCDLVPRRTHSEHRLCEGDALEIVTLVGGG